MMINKILFLVRITLIPNHQKGTTWCRDDSNILSYYFRLNNYIHHVISELCPYVVITDTGLIEPTKLIMKRDQETLESASRIQDEIHCKSVASCHISNFPLHSSFNSTKPYLIKIKDVAMPTTKIISPTNCG